MDSFLKKLFYLFSFLLLISFSHKEYVDLIIFNAVVYTVDSGFSVVNSFAVKDGKIINTGKQEDILSRYDSDNKIDAAGKPIYPGFMDAHCHFLGYGLTLQRVELRDTKSLDEVIERVVEFSKTNKSEWIQGRGWDQNKWQVKEYPDKSKLDSLFPTTPVFIKRIDGHAALVNSEALKRANINNFTKIDGGIIETKNGNLTGILIDNAVDLLTSIIPAPTEEVTVKALLDAQRNCFAVGLTTVDDAGQTKYVIDLIDRLQREGKFKMRMYEMLDPSKENFEYYFKNGIYKTDRLSVRSFKFYADGALGSRGACLLEPYNDKSDSYGYIVEPISFYKKYSKEIYEHNFQMCTHCIGDSANRLMLDIYGDVLKEKNDSRWRIEHCQVINKNDFVKFGKFSIIPSIQPTHATSDMYWASERIGNERIKGAYAYKELLKQFGKIAAGSDFPVEEINPLFGFYAAVSRQDLKGFPEGGFQIENALSRVEALKGMTIWAAFSNFEENEKGSIEPGKFADFVILDEDIMKIEIKRVPEIKVLATYISGEKVF